MDYARLERYLDMPVESSPLWLTGKNKIAYVRRDKQGTNIWTYDLDTEIRQQLTFDDRRVWKIDSSPYPGSLLYAYDENGDECSQIFLLDCETNTVKNLTKAPGVRHFYGGMSADGNYLYYASNRRNQANFDICELNLTSKEERIVTQFADHYNWPIHGALSPNGQYLLYNKLKSEADNALWMSELATGEATRIPNDDLISAEPFAVWSKDSRYIYVLSDRAGEYIAVYRYCLETQEFTYLYGYDWDVSSIALSADDRYLAVFINREGYTDLKIYDLANQGVALNLSQDLPQGVISPHEHASWSEAGHSLLFSFSSGTTPQSIYIYDIDADEVKRLSADPVDPRDKAVLVEPELHRFESFDGLSIPFWYYAPRHIPSSPETQALVIEIHGGPEGQKLPIFDAYIQFLLSEGIQVVAPNVRGSTGYGKRYHHLDDVEKRLDSVQDIAALVAYLVDNAFVSSDKIAVSGTSYGGFMTLSCAARYPALFACAVDIVGMYNLVTFLENTATYRRLHRENEYGSLARDRELLYNVSPVAAIDNIQAPLMVIQGRNDPRVPASESEQLVTRLKNLGKEVHYICYEDEGHGIVKRKNRFDYFPKIVEFLLKHLR